MLYILTGEIQTGKTRWLLGKLDEFDAAHITYAGVIAPGVWREGIVDGARSFEKLGIDNVLLPQRTLIPFARRRDLALEEGVFHAGSQSARAGLGWEISDDAIAAVNAHFDHIEAVALDALPYDLLIVDELGRLELMRNEGLTSAMRILKEGNTAVARDALVIAREDLAATAADMLQDAWGGCELIRPGYEFPHIIGL